MQILSMAGYHFLPLTDLETLRANLWQCCDELAIKGTILLSPEGINVNLAGNDTHIRSFQTYLKQHLLLDEIEFHESYSNVQPYKRLKVKLKKEIITLRNPDIQPSMQRAPAISPQEFKRWLDEKRDLTILDTRNDYEIQFGAFTGALNLHIKDFCEFPQVAAIAVPRDKPIVMYCTGGIRCEKAAIFMLSQGYENVYQLDGGILGYFAQVGGAHYNGECFVFDERVAVDPALQTSGTKQCPTCQAPITPHTAHFCG